MVAMVRASGDPLTFHNRSQAHPSWRFEPTLSMQHLKLTLGHLRPEPPTFPCTLVRVKRGCMTLAKLKYDSVAN
jgi:hypothetical protein